MVEDTELRQAVDAILNPIWARECRRARRRRVAGDAARLLVLMIVPVVLALMGGVGVAAPVLLYFGLLGGFCIFGREGRDRRRRRQPEHDLAAI